VSRRLIVYAKRPLAGYAKTRLGATLGEEQAAGVYARILFAYLLELVAADLPGVELELSLASADDVPFFIQAFPEFDVRAQRGGDLGLRLARSFELAFAAGADAVVLTASDTPELGASVIRAAFQALEHSPVVIGPCQDGGYYLLGLRAPSASLFTGVDWGTERVLQQTEQRASSLGLAVVRLPERIDVDTAQDLARCRTAVE
jgi:rSAM/selenodomain-associated transferase 1